MTDIARILKDGGFKVTQGAKRLLNEINFTPDKTQWLCSGYKVFPDGSKCEGCSDCETYGGEDV